MNRDDILQGDLEILQLLHFSYETRDIPGDVAEVGVYHGGSAKVIRHGMNRDKKLYLFIR